MSDQKSPIKLSEEDWKSLLPGKEITIGSTSFMIFPLGIRSLTNIIVSLKAALKELTEAEITLVNFVEADKFIIFASIILNKAPDVLSIATGVDIEDIKMLPLNPAVKLLEEVIDINVESQENLLKNLTSLAGKMGTIVKTTGE